MVPPNKPTGYDAEKQRRHRANKQSTQTPLQQAETKAINNARSAKNNKTRARKLKADWAGLSKAQQDAILEEIAQEAEVDKQRRLAEARVQHLAPAAPNVVSTPVKASDPLPDITEWDFILNPGAIKLTGDHTTDILACAREFVHHQKLAGTVIKSLIMSQKPVPQELQAFVNQDLPAEFNLDDEEDDEEDEDYSDSEAEEYEDDDKEEEKEEEGEEEE